MTPPSPVGNGNRYLNLIQICSAVLLLTFVGLMLATGCRPARESAETSLPIAVPEYSAKHGVSWPEATRRRLGLKLVDVEERALNATVQLTLRAYRTAQGAWMAQAMIAPDFGRRLRVGQVLHSHLSDGGDSSPRISRINETLAHATGLMEVLVEWPTPPAGVQPGDFLPVTARLEISDPVVTVPREALLECSEGRFVYTVNGDHFLRTAVKTGASDDTHIEITDGLYAGDRVVSQPVVSLWLTELAAVKGGQACCIEPPKGK